MLRIKDILQSIEAYAPLPLQESFDNSGVQVGDTSQLATGVLLCLDITEETIDEAIEHKCNLIVSHHPIAFRPFKSLTGATYVERCMIKACKSDIVLYAAHTNLDNTIGGVSHRMAEKIGLQNISIMDPHPATGTGCGVIGEFADEKTEMSFLQHVKQVFNCKRISHSVGIGKPIKKVAICSGSGAFMIQNAIRAGAEAFISGEAKYNDYYDVEDRILLTIIGHYESEECTKELFYDIISKEFPNFAVHFSNVNSNPVNYL